MRPHHRSHVLVVGVAICAIGGSARAQQAPDLPFAPGERMTYAGRVHVGVSGVGTIWVDGPVDTRGTSTWVLHSDMEGRLGPIRATVRSTSWLAPATMSALRYASSERHLWTRTDEAVNMFPEQGAWSSESGQSGPLVTAQPLDELSFLFYVRTMALADDTTVVARRHFDEARNPTIVRVVGREDLTVGAGRFRAVVVEMRVRDARRYEGEGTIRIHLSDDRCRLLLRMQSTMPHAGTATLELQSYQGARHDCTARL